MTIAILTFTRPLCCKNKGWEGQKLDTRRSFGGWTGETSPKFDARYIKVLPSDMRWLYLQKCVCVCVCQLPGIYSLSNGSSKLTDFWGNQTKQQKYMLFKYFSKQCYLIFSLLQLVTKHPRKFNMEPGFLMVSHRNLLFQGAPIFRFHVRFGGCISWPHWPRRLIPLAGLHVRDVSWRDPIWVKHVRKKSKTYQKTRVVWVFVGIGIVLLVLVVEMFVAHYSEWMIHQSISNFDRIGWFFF